MLATSGTTGEPKGVVLTHDAVRASALATSARLGVTPADHWLACLPLSHVGGLSVVTRAMVTGTPVTVLPGFDADRVEREAAVARRSSRWSPPPSTGSTRALFRTIVLGGARPPAGLPPNVVTTYGMTETGSGVVYDGVPLDGVEVRLDDDGQIHLRGPMLLRAYRDGTDPRDADGWLPTGDLGSWAPDGRLVVHGRAGDLIITGGENVWPEPVEAVIAGLRGVGGVAVAGVDDPTWGQRVVAFVELDGSDVAADARWHPRRGARGAAGLLRAPSGGGGRPSCPAPRSARCSGAAWWQAGRWAAWARPRSPARERRHRHRRR